MKEGLIAPTYRGTEMKATRLSILHERSVAAAISVICCIFPAVSLAEDTVPEDSAFLETSDGCKFMNPYPKRRSPRELTWIGECVDGFVSGSGELSAKLGGSDVVFRGEFERGFILTGLSTNGVWTFEGSFKNNMPSGEGELRGPEFSVKGVWEHGKPGTGDFEGTYPNGRYVGQISSSTWLAHGQGTYHFIDGAFYEGMLKHGVPHGPGESRGPGGEIQRGIFVDGVLQGQATLGWANGSEYQGEVRFGRPHGPGRYKYGDGTVYEGEFVQGNSQGKGRIEWMNGNWYEGDFHLGNPQGHGRYFFADSSAVYVGEVAAGQLHGKGRLEFGESSFKEGEWQKGELYGECRLSYPDGETYTGTCVDGRYDGLGRLERSATNEVYEGEFKGGLFHGEGVLRADSLVYEGMFAQGEMHGSGKLRADGVTLEGEFRKAEFVKGTIQQDGRAFEIDADQGEILEVLPDGSKKPIDEMPPELEI